MTGSPGKASPAYPADIDMAVASTIDEARLQMVRALHVAVYGDVWARPQSPKDVWDELLEIVRLSSAGKASPAVAAAPVGTPADIVSELRQGAAGARRSWMFQDLATRLDEAADEIERLRVLITDLTYRDLEMKVRNGTIDFKSVLGEGSEVAMRWLATMMWHAILGDANEDPENYRSAALSIKPSGELQPISAYIEVIKPGGKSSHTIRQELESEIVRLRALCDAYEQTGPWRTP